MSTTIANIAPDGDLIVAVGNGEHKKLARVLSTILKTASPVFKAMLGPNFLEGKCINDELNPLALPDDDPTAMLNLFKFIHYKAYEVEKSSEYLQKLAVVGDKYRCVPILQDYFHTRFEDVVCAGEETVYAMGVPDRFVVSVLVRDESKFKDYSEAVLRTPRSYFEKALHPCLKQFVPDNMLDEMQAYRERARKAYVVAAQAVFQECCRFTPTDALCKGTRARLQAYMYHLMDRKIYTGFELSDDEYLEDLHYMMRYDSNDVLGHNYKSFGVNDGCQQGSVAICYCNNRMDEIVQDAVNSCEMGQLDNCALCFKCFLAGTFSLEQECELHEVVMPLEPPAKVFGPMQHLAGQREVL